jgi:hypothetical protein
VGAEGPGPVRVQPHQLAEEPQRRSVALKPDAPLLRINLGQTLIGLNDPKKVEEGVQELKRALITDNENSVTWRLLAQAYDKQGKDGEARLATAEQYFSLGAAQEARVFAMRARELLTKDTPDWRRATDIVLASRPQPGPQGPGQGRRDPVRLPPLIALFSVIRDPHDLFSPRPRPRRLARPVGILLGGCSPAKPDKAFGDKVRAYLLEHPEVLLEVSAKLEEKQAPKLAETAARPSASTARPSSVIRATSWPIPTVRSPSPSSSTTAAATASRPRRRS